MAYHCRLRKELDDVPAKHILEYALKIVEEQLWTLKWHVPSDFLSFEHFYRCVTQLDFTSSPGYPHLNVYQTNAAFFSYDNGHFYNESRLHEVYEMVMRQISERRSDPIRLFIKDEPHKVKKLETGRYRLISSVSVIDQLIDSMLFRDMNSLAPLNYVNSPIQVGWTPLKGGWALLPYVTPQIAIDKSSWDWTVQPWILEAVLALRKRLCFNPNAEWTSLAEWRYEALFKSPWFITSGGLLLQQVNPGVMKSGCFNTLMDNSIAQFLLHVVVSLTMNIPVKPIFTMGDDTLQDEMDDVDTYVSILSQYCIVKKAERKREFCGFDFTHWGLVEPVYQGKHAYIMLHMNDKIAQEICDAYCLLYHRSRWRGEIRKLFKRYGFNVRPVELNDTIYDFV